MDSAETKSKLPALSVQPARPHPRWRIVRAVLVLQIKLLLGNLHNFMLMPVCLFAAAVDILFKNRRDEALLYKSLAWGRHLDELIGLYNSIEDEDGEIHNHPDRYSVDALLLRVNSAMRREYEKGGTVASVKNVMDSVMDRAAAEAERHKERAKEALDRTAEKIRSKTETN